MAHLDGKMKEDGVPFNSIEDQGMIQTGDDWKELRLDLDPRVRRMSGRMAVIWRVIKVDGERETRILEILKTGMEFRESFYAALQVGNKTEIFYNIFLPIPRMYATIAL